MGKGSTRGSGRVKLFDGNHGSGRVGSTFRRVGSGLRKVTRGQLLDPVVKVNGIISLPIFAQANTCIEQGG